MENLKGIRRCVPVLVGAALLVFSAFACGALGGCSAPQQTSSESVSSNQQPDQAAERALEGKTLNIYCGAGMTDPFQEIADAFKEETGCDMNVTFANAAQIQTQINTAGEGDFFIAGSADELEPVQSYVAESTNLVKHIPVIAVPADNPKNIVGLSDVASCDRVLVGDPEATPIGKIAKKALTQAGQWDSLISAGVITTTTTAPQIATALANGEGDMGIVWKENAQGAGVKIVDTSDLDSFVKTIPSARLTCCADSDVAQKFSDFLQTDAAWNIWTKYGYERA